MKPEPASGLESRSGPSSASRVDQITCDLCVIGAGPAGIALAATAASCGQSVVLVEKHQMGGTSLNYGTVPATALAASAEIAAAIRGAGAYGIKPSEPVVDWAQLAALRRETVAAFAQNTSAERLGGLGVKVIKGAAKFRDGRTLAVGEQTITAQKFVIATGSSPIIPPIKGLGDVSVFTTDTIFQNREPIEHLIVIGAGPAGTQLAQVHRRLGARVTLLDQSSILGRFDHELVDVVRLKLAAEGVAVYENARIDAVTPSGGASSGGVVGARRLAVQGLINGTPARIEGSHILIACGRRPTMFDIGLDLAKVETGSEGIKTDALLRTTNRRVYAIGDVTGHPYSVQKAEFQARVLVGSLVLGKSAKFDPRVVPVAVYTDPELATVGLSEAEARKAASRIEVHRFPMRENVKALAMRAPEGHIKVTTDRAGRILGVAIAARSAAELIQVWSLAISQGLTLTDMAASVPPHPTLGEINRKASVHRYATVARFAAKRAWGRILARLG